MREAVEPHPPHPAGSELPHDVHGAQALRGAYRAQSAESMTEFMGQALPIDMDTLIAGAILADVGKLLEYDNVDGKTQQSKRGEPLLHAFTGIALAMECGVPNAVSHIVAAHAAEGFSPTRDLRFAPKH